MPSEAEIQQLIDYHLEDAIDTGYAIKSVTGWRRERRALLLENERLKPGFIERSVLAITTRKDGKRLTYCSETRGTHAISYIYDPKGTTEPPAWWNRDTAKAEHDTRHRPPEAIDLGDGAWMIDNREPRPPTKLPAVAPPGFAIPEKESA
jgi:hypothetical protein